VALKERGSMNSCLTCAYCVDMSCELDGTAVCHDEVCDRWRAVTKADGLKSRNEGEG